MLRVFNWMHDTIDCSVMVDFPDVEVEQDDYDGDLFSDFGEPA